MRKNCELCGGVARIYCESDQASLCWDCDEKVHGANFLVAKHTRCLLCTLCQSLTPWKASAPRLGSTISVCDSCTSLRNTGNNLERRQRSGNQNGETNGHDDYEDPYDEDDDDVDGRESYDDDDDDEEYGDDEDEDAENQVVPWAANTAAAAEKPQVVVANSSSSISSGEDVFSRSGDSAMKRLRRNSDLLCSDEPNRG